MRILGEFDGVQAFECARWDAEVETVLNTRKYAVYLCLSCLAILHAARTLKLFLALNSPGLLLNAAVVVVRLYPGDLSTDGVQLDAWCVKYASGG